MLSPLSEVLAKAFYPVPVDYLMGVANRSFRYCYFKLGQVIGAK